MKRRSLMLTGFAVVIAVAVFSGPGTVRADNVPKGAGQPNFSPEYAGCLGTAATDPSNLAVPMGCIGTGITDLDAEPFVVTAVRQVPGDPLTLPHTYREAGLRVNTDGSYQGAGHGVPAASVKSDIDLLYDGMADTMADSTNTTPLTFQSAKPEQWVSRTINWGPGTGHNGADESFLTKITPPPAVASKVFRLRADIDTIYLNNNIRNPIDPPTPLNQVGLHPLWMPGGAVVQGQMYEGGLMQLTLLAGATEVPTNRILGYQSPQNSYTSFPSSTTLTTVTDATHIIPAYDITYSASAGWNNIRVNDGAGNAENVIVTGEQADGTWVLQVPGLVNIHVGGDVETLQVIPSVKPMFGNPRSEGVGGRQCGPTAGDDGKVGDDCAGIYNSWVVFLSEEDIVDNSQQVVIILSSNAFRLSGESEAHADVDGDGLEDCATAQPGRPCEQTADDAGTAVACPWGAIVGIESKLSSSASIGALTIQVDKVGGQCIPNGDYTIGTAPNDEQVTVTGCTSDTTFCNCTVSTALIKNHAKDAPVKEKSTTADRDCDGLLDGIEVAWGSDPTDADTDDDGRRDTEEILGPTWALTDPTNPDTDGDGVDDGGFVIKNGSGTHTGSKFHADLIRDCPDGAATGQEVYEGDNCPNIANAGQENSDSGALSGGADATNPTEDAQGDACDTDNDNDFLPDDAEDDVDNDGPYGNICEGTNNVGTSTGDPDTDDDRMLDGRECQRGYPDPTTADSWPSVPPDNDYDGLSHTRAIPASTTNGWEDFMQTGGIRFAPPKASYAQGYYKDYCGVGMPVATTGQQLNDIDCSSYPNPVADDHDRDSDADGDGLPDGKETWCYGTLPSAVDSDRDGCSDGVEVRDLDGNGWVNLMDIFRLAPPAWNAMPGGAGWDPNLDLDCNAWINLMDIFQLGPPAWNMMCATNHCAH